MAKLAILLTEGKPTEQHLHLGRILDFFGVPRETVEASKLTNGECDLQDCVVFGLAETVAEALQQAQRANRAAPRPAAFFVYTGEDRAASERGLQSLCGNAGVWLREGPAGNLSCSRIPRAGRCGRTNGWPGVLVAIEEGRRRCGRWGWRRIGIYDSHLSRRRSGVCAVSAGRYSGFLLC